MKTFSLYRLAACLIFAATVVSCSDDSGPNEEDQYLAKLAGTWKVSEVVVDGLDVTGAFNNMQLTIDGKNYQITNPVQPIWPESGSFTLQKSTGTQPFKLLRDDEVTMTVEMLSVTMLIIKFQYAVTGNGRSGSISGNYVFKFVK